MTLRQESIDQILNLGGASLLEKMIDAFVRSSPERVDSAVESMQRGDLEMVSRAAHSLKSSAANFGATQLVELVAELETVAREGDAVRSSDLVEDLPALYEQVVGHLETLRQGLTT